MVNFLWVAWPTLFCMAALLVCEANAARHCGSPRTATEYERWADIFFVAGATAALGAFWAWVLL